MCACYNLLDVLMFYDFLGYTPILRATVMATVERPTGDQVVLELKDTGTGIAF